MKINFVLVLFVIATIFASCKKDGGGGGNKGPAVTPVGTVNGTAVTKKIGNAGGSVASTDGMLEVSIPAGALTTDTDITIIPITNNAPNGKEQAYRMLPDGLQFAKDIFLKFYYTDEEAAATKPGYMMAAFQTAAGTWEVIEKLENFPASNYFRASVNHFTDFTAFDLMSISPATWALKPGESKEYKITATGLSTENSALYLGLLDAPITWKANGETGGSPASGTISPATNEFRTTYTAPAAIPTINPVIISAEIDFDFVVNGQQFNKGILTAEAHITNGDYIVRINSELEITIGTLEKFVLKDQGQFQVSLQGIGGAVSHIENSSPTFTKTQNGPTCVTTFDREGTGNIHLSNGSAIQVTNAGGDVWIALGTHTGYIQPIIRTVCGTNTPGVNEINVGDINNQTIEFLNNGQHQVITHDHGVLKFTYTIIPVQ